MFLVLSVVQEILIFLLSQMSLSSLPALSFYLCIVKQIELKILGLVIQI